MSKVLNFDQFMSEKKQETIQVTIFGKEYEVPAQVPAIVPVMMARAERTKNPVDNTRMIMFAADALLGNAAVDELCAKGMGTPDLVSLVTMLFQKINGPDDEEDEAEELTDEDSRTPVSGGKSEKK